MTDDRIDTKSFEYASRRIVDMLGKLGRKNICGCCTGRAMVMHAALICEVMMGSDRAADLLNTAATDMREHDTPAPDYEARH